MVIKYLLEEVYHYDIIRENTTELKGALRGIQNTTSWMIMSINRCIDVSRVRKGYGKLS